MEASGVEPEGRWIGSRDPDHPAPNGDEPTCDRCSPPSGIVAVAVFLPRRECRLLAVGMGWPKGVHVVPPVLVEA